MKPHLGLIALTALAVLGSPAQATATSKLAVTRVVDPSPGFEANPAAEIFVMNGDGSEPRRLTYNETFDLGAVWSPDGKTVAFYSETVPLLGTRIFLIDADDDAHQQRPLTDFNSRFPSWSASGKIAFDNGRAGASDIFVINPDGTGLQQLTHDAQRNIRPDWSPNGQKIAFVSRRSGNDDIYLMNADGSDVTPLTSTPEADNAPAWSPNGQQIVFQRNLAGGNTEIYSMNADGTEQTRLTNYPGRDQDADWAPNGRTIAWERDAEPFTDRILQVLVMNADGSDQRQLTPLGGDDHSENSHPGWGRGPDQPQQPQIPYR